VLVLDAEAVTRALPMSAAIEAMRRAFLAAAEGRAQVPARTQLALDAPGAVCLVMPAHVSAGRGEAACTSVKLVSVVPANPARDLQRIQGSVLVIESETGQARALLDGTRLTALRTGAASGLATRLLARPDAKVLAVLGAGVQAETQIEAVACVRALRSVRVFAPTRAHAQALLDRIAGRAGMPADLVASADVRSALAGADIVCCATTSRTPVFDDAELAQGVHINAVGSFEPDAVEIPAETMARARIYVDSREAALAESGDLIQPIRAGLFGPGHVCAELGEIRAGRDPGRRSDSETTLFESVGLAVQDACAARSALERAADQGIGSRIDYGGTS
jgi:ornithine cyclodeaminase